MSLRQKYDMVKCTSDYENTILTYVKEFLLEHTFAPSDNVVLDDHSTCWGCIPGTYIFYRKNNECDCKLKKCPNFIICESYVPQSMLDEYYGLCYQCSLAYKRQGIGKGILEVYETNECMSCRRTDTCIQQAYCDHILCLECFKINHFKPGNDECPVCSMSRDKYLTTISDEKYHTDT